MSGAAIDTRPLSGERESTVERLVRNDLWKDRSPERFYDAMEWLYGWTADNCLAD